ncbi:MAG: hypothetical protein JWR16_1482 [Nevskia sp.]|nr:hypothetical protein [Nevskia sp.]
MNWNVGRMGKLWPSVKRNAGHDLLAASIWLAGAALGGTFVLGCGGTTGSSFSTGQKMAIAMASQIRLYNVADAVAATGPAPVPVQTIAAANVLSVAFDLNKNLYYLANNGTAGSVATFFSCPAPALGGTYTCHAVGSSIDGGQWLAIDHAATAYATSLGLTGSVISFPIASGPSATPSVVYSSTSLPVAYGGLAVDSGGTLYVTEQPSTTNNSDTLYKCTTVCRNSSGTQADISSQILASAPNSVIGGPLAIGSDGTTLYVGAANPVIVSPSILPVVFVCTPQGTGGLGCQADNVTFTPLGGTDSPYIGTVGVAADSSNNVYDALLLTNYGDMTVTLGPPFFGHNAAGSLFACSSTPSTCPVNQLPSVPVVSHPASVPYGLAISP